MDGGKTKDKTINDNTNMIEPSKYWSELVCITTRYSNVRKQIRRQDEIASDLSTNMLTTEYSFRGLQLRNDELIVYF